MRKLKFTPLKVIGVVVAALFLTTAIVTPADAASSLGYKHVTASLTADNHIAFHWRATSAVKYYKVRTSSTPDMSQNIKTVKVSKSHTTYTIDATATRYAYASPASGNYIFIRVYAMKSNGNIGTSPYERVRLNPIPTSATAQQITVGTFNVRTAQSDVKGHTWASRKSAVAARIKESGASVVAIEEAGDHGSDYSVVVNQVDGHNVKSRDYYWQFEQLRDAVGAPFLLTNDQEYSTGKGKEGTRILYDSSQLTMLAQGDFAPSAVSAYLRYVPWAQFRNNATGETFYFIAAHLDNRTDKGKSHTFYNLRNKQIGTIIAKARTFAASGEQVILAGDMNSNIYSSPKNGVDRKLIAAGFIDAYATTYNVHEFHETFSDYHASKVSASRTDYITTFGRPDLGGASSYRNWVTKSKGIYPSDHNMQSAVVPY